MNDKNISLVIFGFHILFKCQMFNKETSHQSLWLIIIVETYKTQVVLGA
jgi:hypothetical protein